ncbi:hypothetical protein COCCADRAFT_28073 [Bipolaris zeicola 26-R-13]|uniref:Uncharacterized protein n=1 Tax=Cochliobolus carbonum (strain 26-R-13) TaxID=930089 RepID=W6XZG9_COCC2|nr:uncharacterized protein COCCADRAFT_28073 [Bipolaris zeicola 26-R-13]EUC31158.1 hypothetical protein COCCADRAFT_28073 [Bipolaris zeicola 26-R-13]
MSRFGDQVFSNLTALESRRLATRAKDGGHEQGEAMESVMEPEEKGRRAVGQWTGDSSGTPRRTGKPVPVQATRRRLSQTLVEAPSAAISANERGGVRRRNGEGVSDGGTGGGNGCGMSSGCQVHSRVARSNTTPLQAQPDAGQRGRRSPRHPGKASVLPSIVGTDLHKRVVALLLAAER